MQPEDPIPPRALGPLRAFCAAMALGALLCAGLVWLLAGSHPVPGLPGLPLSLTAAATVLILLASRIRSGLVRRALLWAAPAAGADASPAVIAAYRRATFAAFALLEASAALGLLLALVTGSVRYGLVLCAASLAAMLVRWPRHAELARLLRRLQTAT